MKKQTATMQDPAQTAKTLSEALPHLQRYSGAVVVVKFGGNAMGDDAAMAEFARDIVLMRQVGLNPVVVHGGGPMINEMLQKLGIKSEFVRGKRVTDRATVEVVEMILSGLVNKRIVQAIMDAGGRAVGISGKDDDLMVCEADDPELGFVGRPVEMNVQVLRDLYGAGIIPVVAPVATGMADNETFNVNGDTAAGAILRRVAGGPSAAADRCFRGEKCRGRGDDADLARRNPPDDGGWRDRGWHDPQDGNRADGAGSGCARGDHSGWPSAQCGSAGTVHRFGRRVPDPLYRAAGQTPPASVTLGDIAARATAHHLNPGWFHH